MELESQPLKNVNMYICICILYLAWCHHTIYQFRQVFWTN